MVAYSFQKQFAPDIAACRKTHTIRGNRKRHARVGEPVQLYTGMRTKHCLKIIPDPVCTFVEPIDITITADGEIMMIWIGKARERTEVFKEHFDQFARLDGFIDSTAMAAFWMPKRTSPLEGLTCREFDGWIIGWGKHPFEVLGYE